MKVDTNWWYAFTLRQNRISTNSSTWAEKVLSFEALPESMLQTLRRVHNFLTKTQGSSSNFSLESLLGTSNDIYRRTDLMKFLCNATLLCLSVFPRNFVLEDAALVAEELSVMNSNPSSCSVTPCRALAKFLLKSDRQVVVMFESLMADMHTSYLSYIGPCFYIRLF